jgi:hypothetical protein
MSNSPQTPSAPSASVHEDEASWDLDREWADARTRAGLSPDFEVRREEGPRPVAATVSPFLLLYSGFFLGPWATMLVALAALSQRPTARFVVLVLSLCAAFWLMIQGITLYLFSSWPLLHLQILRAGLNLTLGAMLIFAVRASAPRPIVHTPRALQRTAAVSALILLTYYLWRSSAVLAWLGR